MGVRRLVFGSKRRVVLVVLIAAAVGAYSAGVAGLPAVTDVENRFGPVDENATTVHTELVVDNPAPVGVELGGVAVDYTVSMNDVALANGSKRGVDVRPGRDRVPFTTRMDNERIPRWWVTHVRNDETTEIRVDATVRSSLLDRSFDLPQERTVETDIIGQFRSTEDRPVDADSPLVSDPVLVVRETDARWGDVTAGTTPIEMAFVVYNSKAVSYPITEIGYTITMNGLTVGNGTTEDPAVLAARSETTVRATTAIENDRLDDWWVTHLRSGETTDLRIDFHATARLGAATVRLPLDELTYTRTIETDVFGTKTETAPNGSERRDAGGETAPSSATPAGATDASSSTPTATPADDLSIRSPTAPAARTAIEGADPFGGNVTDADGSDGSGALRSE